MPCTESNFNNLIRNPMGISKYNTQEFNEYCEVALEVANRIKSIIESNYRY